MIFGEILGFGDFGGNPGVWFLVLPTNFVYTTNVYILNCLLSNFVSCKMMINNILIYCE